MKLSPMKLSIPYLYTIFTYGYPPTPAGDLRRWRTSSEWGFSTMKWKWRWRWKRGSR